MTPEPTRPSFRVSVPNGQGRTFPILLELRECETEEYTMGVEAWTHLSREEAFDLALALFDAYIETYQPRKK